MKNKNGDERIKEKPVSFKMKNKEIARKKIELEKEIKSEIIIETEESKVEILRDITEKKLRELNTERKLKKKEMKKVTVEEIYQRGQ